jgi:hypothetical protein
MMNRTEDYVLSGLVLIVAATLGLSVIAMPARGDGDSVRPSVPRRPPILLDPFDARVIAVANAIAIGEGYYASGDHDGHSLPYRLNNPGALKKPALGAEELPTWKDTGLVIFPTREMGWTALRHQVRGMLGGTSIVYQTTDTLELVGHKYSDGDPNWAVNVAALLGVSTEATLEDLLADIAHER